MKKYIVKLMVIVALVFGLTITASAVEVPESATPLVVDTHLRFAFSQYPYEHWYSSDSTTLMDEWQDGTLNDQSPIIYPAVIFGNNFDPYVLKDTTTYYMQYELTTQSDGYFFGMTTNASFYKVVRTQQLIDLFGQYTSTDTQQTTDPRIYNLTELKDISREITTTVTQVNSKTMRIAFAFSTKSGIESDNFSAMMLDSIGSLDEKDRLELKEFYAWTDESLSIYEDLVSGKLDDIQGSIDDLGNKIDQGNDQAHQDAEDIKDSIEALPEKEKQEADSSSNDAIGSAQAQMGQFDVSSLGSGISSLLTAVTHTGKDAIMTFPSSGDVPFLGIKLWEEQTIDLVPESVTQKSWWNMLYICTNFIVCLGTAYTVAWMLNDLLTTMGGDKA